MKWLFIILVVVMLLGGGGAGGWWFFLREPLGEPEVVEAEPFPEPVFVDMDPFTVPVIQDGRVVQQMSIIIVLEVETVQAKEAIDEATLQLRDAYFKELHVLLARRFVWEDRQLVPFVKRRLMAASALVLGEGVVADVLIRGVQGHNPNSA